MELTHVGYIAAAEFLLSNFQEDTKLNFRQNQQLADVITGLKRQEHKFRLEGIDVSDETYSKIINLRKKLSLKFVEVQSEYGEEEAIELIKNQGCNDRPCYVAYEDKDGKVYAQFNKYQGGTQCDRYLMVYVKNPEEAFDLIRSMTYNDAVSGHMSMEYNLNLFKEKNLTDDDLITFPSIVELMDDLSSPGSSKFFKDLSFGCETIFWDYNMGMWYEVCGNGDLRPCAFYYDQDDFDDEEDEN